MKLAQALSRIAPSRTTAITDRATELRAAGKDVISLSVGEPDFATPPHVVAAAKAALDAGETKYTPVAGTQRLREAAALHFRRDLGLTVSPEQVIVSDKVHETHIADLKVGDNEIDVPVSAEWGAGAYAVAYYDAYTPSVPTISFGGPVAPQSIAVTTRSTRIAPSSTRTSIERTMPSSTIERRSTAT